MTDLNLPGVRCPAIVDISDSTSGVERVLQCELPLGHTGDHVASVQIAWAQDGARGKVTYPDDDGAGGD